VLVEFMWTLEGDRTGCGNGGLLKVVVGCEGQWL
jgi:hypothetical protein